MMGKLFHGSPHSAGGGDVSLRTVVRIASIVLLVYPFVRFAIEYWFAVGSFDGFVEYLPIAFVDSGVAFINSVIADPIRGFLFIVLGTLTWWGVVGIPQRKKKP